MTDKALENESPAVKQLDDKQFNAAMYYYRTLNAMFETYARLLVEAWHIKDSDADCSVEVALNVLKAILDMRENVIPANDLVMDRVIEALSDEKGEN